MTETLAIIKDVQMLTLLFKDYGTVCSTRTLYSLCLINVQLLPGRQREGRYLRLASSEKTMRGYRNKSMIHRKKEVRTLG